MGKINIEGLGVVEIAGDEPTIEESQIIVDNYAKAVRENQRQLGSTQQADNFLQSKEFGRLVTEIAFTIGGSILTGGAGLPLLAARAGIMSRPFFAALAKSSAGAGAGGGTGAGVAQTFDPQEDVVREIVRGGVQGALSEGIGAPIAIRGTQLVSQFIGKNPFQLVKSIENADDAEKALQAQAGKVLEDPNKYLSQGNVDKLVEAAKEAQKGLTVGVKADSRLLDIVENVGENAIIGSGSIVKRKAGLRLVANTSVDDFVDEYAKNLEKNDFGNMFFTAISDSEELFKKSATQFYKGVDDLLAKTTTPSGQSLKVMPVVPTDNVKRVAAEQLKRYGLEDTTLNNTVRQINAKPVALTFQEADDLRGALLSRRRQLLASQDTKVAGSIDQIRKALDDTLASDLPVPEIVKLAQKRANEFYAGGKKTFNDAVIKKVLKSENIDDVFQTIVRTGDKPTTIERTFATLENMATQVGPEGIPLLTTPQVQLIKNSIKGQFLKNLADFSKRPDPVHGDFYSANAVNSFLNKFKLSKSKIFTPDELKKLEDIKNQLSFAQGKLNQEGRLPGGIFIQLKQAGALTSIGGFATLGYGGYEAAGIPGTAVAILGGPYVLNKLLLNPKISELLFKQYGKGELGKTTTSKAGVAYRQLLGRLFEENLINSEQFTKATEESKITEKQLLDAGVKNAKDFRPNAPIQTTRPQTNLAPINTQVTQPRANLFTTQQPTMPPAPMPSPMVASTDRSQQYAGLFPFDITGQQIARQG